MGDISYIAESIILRERKQLNGKRMSSSYAGLRLRNDPMKSLQLFVPS